MGAKARRTALMANRVELKRRSRGEWTLVLTHTVCSILSAVGGLRGATTAERMAGRVVRRVRYRRRRVVSGPTPIARPAVPHAVGLLVGVSAGDADGRGRCAGFRHPSGSVQRVGGRAVLPSRRHHRVVARVVQSPTGWGREVPHELRTRNGIQLRRNSIPDLFFSFARSKAHGPNGPDRNFVHSRFDRCEMQLKGATPSHCNADPNTREGLQP